MARRHGARMIFSADARLGTSWDRTSLSLRVKEAPVHFFYMKTANNGDFFFSFYSLKGFKPYRYDWGSREVND